jgi:hypothetical protein
VGLRHPSSGEDHKAHDRATSSVARRQAAAGANERVRAAVTSSGCRRRSKPSPLDSAGSRSLGTSAATESRQHSHLHSFKPSEAFRFSVRRPEPLRLTT